ncbi:hypothetical protein SEA_SHROOMBOI_57 [Mycobacterium phage ShroomBoi]|uniref:Uncharacterized protein n=1 Tax=Mycobacterium phage Kersh TaxID=1897501 RepID=A0A1D8EXT8_9CAUD|nr:hypothetical protein I5H52_gp057 [Mycobacterium phage Kersh]AOT26039.1 hypothetical protein SEA_KERSH_57 [Mycobacterium phage Kersh]WKW86442.1 hypothetical protein SEA_SHROOMBOI_57 [Mycobacterium phage ShroomBoi]
MLDRDSKPSWWDNHQTTWADLPVTRNAPMADLDLLKELEDLAELVLIHVESVSWFRPFLPPAHWETEPTIWEQMNGDAVVGLLHDYLTTGEAA